MDAMSSAVDIVKGPEFWAALLAVSEVLALIPSIKANSIFQAVTNGLKALATKK